MNLEPRSAREILPRHDRNHPWWPGLERLKPPHVRLRPQSVLHGPSLGILQAEVGRWRRPSQEVVPDRPGNIVWTTSGRSPEWRWQL